MKNKWLGLIVSIIAFPAVWTLLDYLYLTLINKEAFRFKLLGHLILPAIVGAVYGYFSFFRKKEGK